MIRTAAEVAEGFDVRTEVCVIGSGAGGGVAAALAAEAGREVLVLEEGPHVPAAKMTQREEQMYPLLYRDGGNQQTADGGITVLQGRVLGGSTVVNMADVTGVPDAVLTHWARHHGISHWADAQVREAEQACRAVIFANRIPETQLNRNNRVLLEGARARGMHGAAFEHNRVGCVGSGYCLIGCAYDAKKSVALTWVPRALATGRALFQTEARVERIEHDGGRVTAVSGNLVGWRDSQPLAPFRVRADRFVLAAGAIHSPLLLADAGLGGPQVGRNLSLQPQVPLAVVYPDEVRMFRGIPQACFVDSAQTDDPDQGLVGFRLEPVAAGPGMAANSNALDPEALHRFMSRYVDAAACLCLVPDQPGGTVTRDGDGRAKIAYQLSPAVEKTLRQAMGAAARAYLASGAEAVMLPFPDAWPVYGESDLVQLDRWRIASASTPLISAHPQGTCRMGPDPARAVVGPDLRVHGTDNLWVLDASVFPTSAATHTMLPVMTYAWLGAQAMLEG